MAEFAWILVVGVTATLVMDLWALGARHLLGLVPLDYALVGRWVLAMPAGRFVHDGIAKAPARRGERQVGWLLHYAIGVAFAALLLAAAGREWARAPSPGAALAFGVATVAAPFLVLQPALGLGMAASRTPRPAVARVKSVASHLVFGGGLYLGAVLARPLLP